MTRVEQEGGAVVDGQAVALTLQFTGALLAGSSGLAVLLARRRDRPLLAQIQQVEATMTPRQGRYVRRQLRARRTIPAPEQVWAYATARRTWAERHGAWFMPGAALLETGALVHLSTGSSALGDAYRWSMAAIIAGLILTTVLVRLRLILGCRHYLRPYAPHSLSRTS